MCIRDRDKQVADRHFARHPRIVHPEPRHMLDNRIIPRNPALVDQDRERRRGHRLAGRAGLEQRLLIDRRARPKLCLLYTSAAADERTRSDLGGRRLHKKKK